MADRIIALAEVLVAAFVVLGHNVWRIVPNEVLVLLVIGWVSLRLRRVGWRGVGLTRPPRFARTVLIALGVAAALQTFGVLVLDPLLERFFGRSADLSELAPLVGNPLLALLALLVIWTFAAFGEELVYRGYVLNRAADVLGGARIAWVVALALTVALFAYGHVYKGAPGMVDSGLSALVLGSAYLASGRNLWLPILIHGFSDTIGLWLVFSGWVPITS